MVRRTAIKKVLEKEFTVYNVGILDKEAKLTLPFLILGMSGERRAMHSCFITFSIFIYVPIIAPIILDECEKKVRKLLHKKRIESDDGAFFVECDRSTAEFVSEKMEALCKVIEVRIPSF